MLNKTEIANSATRAFNRVGLKLKKHSPEILVVAGVVGMVGSAVLACKATLKVNAIAEETKNNLDRIGEAAEKGATAIGETYTPEDARKETGIVYVQTGVKLAKLYGPAVLLGGLSATAILAGHNITRKRNVALAAAYTAVDKGFKEYRGRLIERFGEELDKELKYNIKAQEVEEIVTNDDGSETIVKKTINVVDPNGYSDYARIYDDGCNGWTKNPEYNLMFLKDQQRYANDLLQSRGHLFLNEVYDMLGFGRTEAGQMVGWIFDEECPNGDNFVDFGIFDINNPKARDFVNGYERNIILDFNVDGPIYNLI